jgi:hypothetical protein
MALTTTLTLIFSFAGFLPFFISSGYALGWHDEEWTKAGCPNNVSGNWIADNPVNKNLKSMSFNKREITYTSQNNETQRFRIIKSSFVKENQFVKIKIKPLNNEKHTIIKIRPHLVHIDSKVKNEISRCMIKVFSFHTEKHAQTNRYSAWNIFKLIKY